MPNLKSFCLLTVGLSVDRSTVTDAVTIGITGCHQSDGPVCWRKAREEKAKTIINNLKTKEVSLKNLQNETLKARVVKLFRLSVLDEVSKFCFDIEEENTVSVGSCDQVINAQTGMVKTRESISLDCSTNLKNIAKADKKWGIVQLGRVQCTDNYDALLEDNKKYDELLKLVGKIIEDYDYKTNGKDPGLFK